MQNPFGNYNSSTNQGYSPPGFDQSTSPKKGYAPVTRTGTEESTMIGEEGDGDLFDFRRSGHPIAGMFHLGFKVLTIVR